PPRAPPGRSRARAGPGPRPAPSGCSPRETRSPRLPRSHVAVLAVTARGRVGAQRPDVVVAVIPRAALVRVRAAPRIERHHRFLEIRPVPVGHVRILDERLQPDRRGWIAADNGPVLVQRGADQLDLRPRRGLLALAHAAEQARAHQTRDEPEDDDDDEELDEREATLIAEEASHRSLSHSGTSVTERMAISMATTMKPTTTPITRMMHGSARAMSRLTSLRVSASSSVATRSSISSRRPVSSPTRTMWVASAGNAPDSAIGWARAAARRAPSARRSTAPPGPRVGHQL